MSQQADARVEPAAEPEGEGADGSCNSSDTDSDVAISSSEDSDSDSAQLAERPFRKASEKAEEKETNLVLEAHFEQIEIEAEARSLRAEKVDEGVQPKSSTQAPPAAKAKAVAKGTTFCNRELGVMEVSVQVANRLAKCRHCVTPIAKGTTRFGYAWSLKKFHSYLHCACLVEYLQIENLPQRSFQQALDFLLSWQEREGESNGALMSDVRAAISDLIKAQRGFQVSEAQASSASSSRCPT